MNNELIDSLSCIFLIAFANRSDIERTLSFEMFFFNGIVSVTAISSNTEFCTFS